jgi:hypothetical protein
MDYPTYARRESEHVDMMARMMKRLGVNPVTAAALDGGLGGFAACTRCIFCQKTAACESWLSGEPQARTPKEFCPNATYFSRCLDTEPVI